MKEEYLSSLKVKVDWQSLTTDEIDLVLEARIRMYQESVKENGHEAVREGYVLERIASIHNLRKADSLAQDGKVKINRYIRRHNLRKEEDLRALQMMILTLTFPDPEYTSDEIKSDAGKVRQIVKQKYFPWRILHYAIMLVSGPMRDLYSRLLNAAILTASTSPISSAFVPPCHTDAAASSPPGSIRSSTRQ